jgi:hypothetical protein
MNFEMEEMRREGSGATTQRGDGLRTTSPRGKSPHIERPHIERNDQFSKVLTG